jgi:hypothetical protein
VRVVRRLALTLPSARSKCCVRVEREALAQGAQERPLTCGWECLRSTGAAAAAECEAQRCHYHCQCLQMKKRKQRQRKKKKAERMRRPARHWLQGEGPKREGLAQSCAASDLRQAEPARHSKRKTTRKMKQRPKQRPKKLRRKRTCSDPHSACRL